MRDLGYPVGRANGGWVPHDLRRLGVLQLYEHGADQRVAMEFVGHHVAKVHAHYVRALGDRVNEIVSSVSDQVALPPQDDVVEELPTLAFSSFEALTLNLDEE